MSARNVAFFPHAFVNTSLVCAMGVIARACVTSFGWPSRGSEPASNAAAVVDRVSEKAECALRRYRFVFLYISLFFAFLFCPTAPLRFRRSVIVQLSLHQQRGLFPTTDSYRAQRKREHLSSIENYWQFLLLRICICFKCVLFFIPS